MACIIFTWNVLWKYFGGTGYIAGVDVCLKTVQQIVSMGAVTRSITARNAEIIFPISCYMCQLCSYIYVMQSKITMWKKHKSIKRVNEDG